MTVSYKVFLYIRLVVSCERVICNAFRKLRCICCANNVCAGGFEISCIVLFKIVSINRKNVLVNEGVALLHINVFFFYRPTRLSDSVDPAGAGSVGREWISFSYPIE